MKKLILTICILLSVSNYAQVGGGSVAGTDPISTSMAKTYAVTARGIHALGVNPGLLTWDTKNTVEFTAMFPAPYVTIRAGFDFMTLDEYNYFFGGSDQKNAKGEKVGKYLTPEDKDRFRNLFSSGGLALAQTSASMFAFVVNTESAGSFGFGISDMVSFKIKIPQTFADLLLDGNPAGSVYNFNGLATDAWWLRKYSLSYGMDLDLFDKRDVLKTSAGISLNLIHGFMYFGIERINTYLETGPNFEITGQGDLRAIMSFSNSINANYGFDSLANKGETSLGFFPDPAGTGFGIDLGFGIQFDEIWSVGVAMSNIGSITWKSQAAEFVSDGPIYLDDILSQQQRDSLVAKLKGDGRYIDEFSTGLPTVLRIGVSAQMDKLIPDFFTGHFLVAFDYNQGFNNLPGNSTKPRFSLGMEWDPMPDGWFPYLRTGFSFGGDDVFGWAIGGSFHIGPVELMAATSDFHYIFTPNKTQRVSFSFGSRWHF